MSKRQMEVLVDDIDGTPIVDETQGRTIPVQIGEFSTNLDLTNENIEALEKVFRDFIGQSERPQQNSARRTSTEDLSVVREWARRNGYKVNARGRIPFSVMDAFTKAHVNQMR